MEVLPDLVYTSARWCVWYGILHEKFHFNPPPPRKKIMHSLVICLGTSSLAPDVCVINRKSPTKVNVANIRVHIRFAVVPDMDAIVDKNAFQ